MHHSIEIVHLSDLSLSSSFSKPERPLGIGSLCIAQGTFFYICMYISTRHVLVDKYLPSSGARVVRDVPWLCTRMDIHPSVATWGYGAIPSLACALTEVSHTKNCSFLDTDGASCLGEGRSPFCHTHTTAGVSRLKGLPAFDLLFSLLVTIHSTTHINCTFSMRLFILYLSIYLFSSFVFFFSRCRRSEGCFDDVT